MHHQAEREFFCRFHNVFRPDIAIRFFPAVHGIKLIRASAGFDDVMLKRAFPTHAATGAQPADDAPQWRETKFP